MIVNGRRGHSFRPPAWYNLSTVVDPGVSVTDRRIALLIETSHSSAREKLRGVLAFIREQGVAWQIDHEPQRLERGPPEWLRRWQGDGIIACSHCPKTMAAIVRADVPAVELLGVARDPTVPLVIADDRAICSLAAEHLVASGLASLAFVGVKNRYWSARRRDGFREALAAAGETCRVFEFEQHQRSILPPVERVKQLAAWLRGLPRPVGILAANDQYAVHVATACRAAGIAIPDDAAIVGVDNDEAFCELATPPLTSIAADHFAAGHAGAELLRTMIEGRAPRRRPKGAGTAGDWVAREVPPLGIVERRSTDCCAAPDPDVAAALHVMRKHFHEPLTIEDVAERLAVSRATLVRRFADVLGRGFHEELTTVRLREAKRLLAGTDLPLSAVADRCGFTYQQHMNRLFRNRLGTSPSAYRARHRRR
jgi:LacI family transcriptional regulator